MRTIELFRHTANDGDRLTPEGIAAAVALGRELAGAYAVAVSSGAQRATQTIACLLAAGTCTVNGGVVVVAALRSEVEERWREAYREAGAGDLHSLAGADAELVAADSGVLAAGLRAVFAMLQDGERALAIGHSPTNEAAVVGLTGEIIEPMGKGDRVILVEDGGRYSVHHPRGGRGS